MAQYCKANGISAEKISSGTELDKARAYAIKEAQKATYRDINNFSQMISRLGRSQMGKNAGSLQRLAGTIVEGVLPFRKTPANILVRGVEYSPAGLIKALAYDLPRLGLAQKGMLTNTKNVKSGAEIIDLAASGLTGTGLMLLGMTAKELESFYYRIADWS